MLRKVCLFYTYTDKLFPVYAHTQVYLVLFAPFVSRINIGKFTMFTVYCSYLCNLKIVPVQSRYIYIIELNH